MAKKTADPVDEFDFGFSFVDENIEQVKQQHASDADTILKLEARVQKLYDSIVPFLDNLCSNADTPTIHWPNRVEKISQFKAKLKHIAEGKHDELSS